MRYETTARDFFYETSGATALTYYITCDDVPIYNGTAVKSPDKPVLRINVGRRVSDYLRTSLPDFRNLDGVVVPHTEQIRDFKLYDSQGNLLEEYRTLYGFCGDWDGEDFLPSDPIDGKADPRQKVFWGVVTKYPDTVIITGETTDTGSTELCCENVPKLSVELSDNVSFSTSPIEIASGSPFSGTAQIVSFSTDEEAQGSGYPVAGYYLINFSGSTGTPVGNNAYWAKEFPGYLPSGGTLETTVELGLFLGYPNRTRNINSIVAPYANNFYLRGETVSRTYPEIHNVISGINADNAEFVKIGSEYYDEYVYRTTYPNLKNLCFYNALYVYIEGGRNAYDAYENPYSEHMNDVNVMPALESIDLPNATFAKISAIGTPSFNSFNAPKLKTGRLCFDGTSITNIYLPEFERDYVPTGGDEEDRWFKYRQCDFSFINCTGLTEVYFGPNYKGIWGTFYGCTGIEEYSNKNVNSIQMKSYEFWNTNLGYDGTGAGTFDHCTNLKTINLPNLKYAGPRSFACCEALTAVTFPELETLDALAFYGCNHLKEVNLPKLESISMYGTFAYCTRLEKITLDFVSVIGYGNHTMFDHCTSLKEVTLGTVDKGLALFGQSSSLQTIRINRISWWGTLDTNHSCYIDLPASVRHLYLPSSLNNIYSWNSLTDYGEGRNIEIHYDGTLYDWNRMVDRGVGHYYSTRIKVIHCTDGDKTLL